MNRKPDKRMKLVRGIAWVVPALLILIAIYYFSPVFVDDGKKQTIGGKEQSGSPPEKTSGIDAGKQIPQRESAAIAELQVVIIIDDIGFNLSAVRELLKIDAPVAFAVLPHAPHSVAAAEMLHGAGREILLHLPMEPHDSGKDPGSGALYRRMGEAEIRRQMEEDIAAVPHVAGVNNHMGSAFMEEEQKLAIVFQELKNRDLFFIDSRTTPHSRAEELAIRTGVRFAARKVFIDNDQNHDITLRNLLGILERNHNSRVVMIGHPYPSTILALQEAVLMLRAKGVAILPPSAMVEIIDRAETDNKKD